MFSNFFRAFKLLYVNEGDLGTKLGGLIKSQVRDII